MKNERGIIMKKLLCLLLALCLLPACAFMESVDLSQFSFDELRILQNRISEEITKRPEWKPVSVPPGLYEIGKDIPAGEWCLKCGKSDYGGVVIRYGKTLNSSRTSLDMPWDYSGTIYEQGDSSKMDKLNITLSEGYFIEIQYGQLIFSAPEKVDLGF